jgi:hypothetical protein
VSRTVAPRLAAGLLLLTVAALAAGGGFGIAAHDLMNAFAFDPVLLAFAVVGAVVASRRRQACRRSKGSRRAVRLGR